MSNQKDLWFFSATTPITLDRYLAQVESSSPFIAIYDYSDQDNPFQIADPATLPAGSGNSCDWRPSSVLLGVAHAVTPFITFYELQDSVATKIADPATLPTTTGMMIRFSPDGRWCAVGCASSGTSPQTLFIYDLITDAPVNVAGVVAFIVTVNSLSWSWSSQYLTVNEFVYDMTSGTPVLAHTLVMNNVVDASWSIDDRYLCMMDTASPFIGFFDWDSGSPVKLADPVTTIPSTGHGCVWDLVDDRVVQTIHGHIGVSPGNDSTRYDLTSGLAVAITDLNPEPSVAGAGTPQRTAMRSNNERLAVCSDQSTRLFVYDNTVSPPVGVGAPANPGSASDDIAWGGQESPATVVPPLFVLWNSSVEAQGYQFDGTDIVQSGPATVVTGLATSNRGSITAVSDVSIVVGGVDGFANVEMAQYTLQVGAWVLDGNISTVNINSFPCISATSSDRVAIARRAAGQETKDFDGTDWNSVGNVLTGAGAQDQKATGGANDQVFYLTLAATAMQIYSFDGTDWALDSSDSLGFTAISFAQLNANDIAIFDFTNGELKHMTESGGVFTQNGNGLSVALGAANCMCALSETRIVVGDNANDSLQVYDWDGTDWTATGNALIGEGVPEWRNLVAPSYLLF